MAMYWHEATGHTNLTFLRSICTTVDGMEELQQLPSDYKLPPCSVCMLAKSRALPTPKKAERSKMVHHLVHSDTTERNVQAGRAPAVLRTDNAGEMTSETFEAQLAAEGTFHQKSVAYSQYQNGRAESAIRTVSTRARTLLMHSGVHARYWDYAVEYATFLENVARPHTRGSLLTPYQVFHGSGPPRFPSLNIPLEEEVVETQDDDTQPEAYEPNRRPRSRANRASRNRRRGRQASA
mmetsp:Transcript_62040/g.128382  ORF Transcript_62040/g.128382 Transcript_62040/m.128382 type:complete len:237 (-) Transcript_62040:2605-3315(-)